MKHPIVAHSALGSDTLRFRAMQGREALSALFEFEVDLVADTGTLDLKALLGQPLTLEIETASGATRYLDGIVARAMLLGRDGSALAGAAREYRYRAIVRPWLWLLTQSRDCKIFQNQTVPDIVQAVLADYGFPVASRLTASYRSWTYCVQYQESDFDFVSRLLEHEGIHYYFEHALGSHTLVLADDMGAHATLPDAASIPFFAAERVASADIDSVDAYEVAEEFAPGVFVTDDYNFTRPRASLKDVRTNPNAHQHGDLEVYEWMGGYGEAGDASHYSRIRLEELQAEKERDAGHAWSRSLAAGYRFSLRNCPRLEANREYLLVEVTYRLRDPGYASDGGTFDTASYECDFVTHPATLPFRPRRATPKPSTQGPQTAVVVGPPGETVWTDEYGRVKVQFRWDRYGKNDENSSCWLRVVSSAAGSGMGAVNLPRIGQEVVVDFIGGEPDRPIVMGSTYNADMMTAFGLPAQASRSGFVSRTFKGGPSQANHLYFEDKPGAEELALHAEKDYSASVEHDKTNTVGNDHDESISGQSRQVVAGSKHTTVAQHYTHVVRGASKRQVVGSSRQTHASDFHHTTVGPSTVERRAPHSQRYGARYTHRVDGPATSTYLAPHLQHHNQTLKHGVAADHRHRVGADHTHQVKGSHSLDVGGDHDHTVQGNHSKTVGAGHVHTVSGDHLFSVKGNSSHAAANSHTTVANKVVVGAGTGGGSGKKPLSSHGDATQISLDAVKIAGSYVSSFDFATLKVAATVGNAALDVVKAAATVTNFAINGIDMKVARLKSEAVALEVKAHEDVAKNAVASMKFLFGPNIRKAQRDNTEPGGADAGNQSGARPVGAPGTGSGASGSAASGGRAGESIELTRVRPPRTPEPPPRPTRPPPEPPASPAPKPPETPAPKPPETPAPKPPETPAPKPPETPAPKPPETPAPKPPETPAPKPPETPAPKPPETPAPKPPETPAPKPPETPTPKPPETPAPKPPETPTPKPPETPAPKPPETPTPKPPETPTPKPPETPAPKSPETPTPKPPETPAPKPPETPAPKPPETPAPKPPETPTPKPPETPAPKPPETPAPKPPETPAPKPPETPTPKPPETPAPKPPETPAPKPPETPAPKPPETPAPKTPDTPAPKPPETPAPKPPETPTPKPPKPPETPTPKPPETPTPKPPETPTPKPPETPTPKPPETPAPKPPETPAPKPPETPAPKPPETPTPKPPETTTPKPPETPTPKPPETPAPKPPELPEGGPPPTRRHSF